MEEEDKEEKIDNDEESEDLEGKKEQPSAGRYLEKKKKKRRNKQNHIQSSLFFYFSIVADQIKARLRRAAILKRSTIEGTTCGGPCNSISATNTHGRTFACLHKSRTLYCAVKGMFYLKLSLYFNKVHRQPRHSF